MMKEDKRLDDIFSALASKHRRAIVYRLALNPASVTMLAKHAGLSLQAMHKHIALLEDARLVIRKKSGRSNFLALSRESLLVLSDWVNQYNAHWGNDGESLSNYIKEIEKKSKIKKLSK